MDFPPVEEQMAVVRRGAVDLVDDRDLRQRLEQSRASGRPLRVKLGIDPSSPDIHLGHTVVLRKLRDFQQLGHTAIVLWGTATAMLGDPSGRNKTRPPLSRAQVEANKQTYRDQVGAVLDMDRVEERENGEWFFGQAFLDCVRLAGRYTVARLLERDDFRQRFQAGQPISVHELLYPLLQGWDSVELAADVELGGTDQLFNLLVGRELQKQEGCPAQVCLTMPLIEGLDGTQKMSKSLGNWIGVREPAGVMFGKLMKVPNELLAKYFALLTAQDEAGWRPLLERPLDAKFELARQVVTDYHGAAAAAAARAEYDRMHQRGGLPDHVPAFRAEAAALVEGRLGLASALVLCALCKSTSDGRRLIAGGGVRVDGEVARDPKATLAPGTRLLQVGRQRAARIEVPEP